MYKVYGLIDPLTYYVRYIGVTVKHLEVRLEEHVMLRDGNKIKIQWLTTLVELGLKPSIMILGYAKDKETAYKIEKEWILKGYSFGWPLTNGTNKTSEDEENISFPVPVSTRDLAVVQSLLLCKSTGEIIREVYKVDGKGKAYQESVIDIRRIISERIK